MTGDSTMTTQLQKHQQVLLEMLVETDRICKKHNIKYMLFAGSALGAVRHQGFIPWDDDLDVVMCRSDYERFLEVAPRELNGEDYFLQKEFDAHWPMFFSKLRKNGTACIERYIPRDPQTHQGVYIDIFPCDNLSDSRIVRNVQFLASKVVIARGLYRRGYLTDSPLKKLFMQLCRLVPSGPFWRAAVLAKAKNTRMVHCFFGGASRFPSSVFPRAWMEETVLLPFCGRMFPVSAHYHALLTTLYGDYMVLPKERERGRKIHAEIVDLEHSYELYSDIQKQMKFQEYTRSIR